MPKKQQTKRSFLLNHKAVLAIALAVVAIPFAICCFLQFKYVDRYNRAADIAEMSTTRELILQAVKNIKRPGAVEPKTGDVYFPEAKLYLPAPQNLGAISYSTSVDQSKEIVTQVTHSYVMGQAESKLYQATHIDQLFEYVPQLQACSRGVTLQYTKMTDTKVDLRHEVKLANGKTLYVYTEKACSNIKLLADALQNIKSY